MGRFKNSWPEAEQVTTRTCKIERTRETLWANLEGGTTMGSERGFGEKIAPMQAHRRPRSVKHERAFRARQKAMMVTAKSGYMALPNLRSSVSICKKQSSGLLTRAQSTGAHEGLGPSFVGMLQNETELASEWLVQYCKSTMNMFMVARDRSRTCS